MNKQVHQLNTLPVSAVLPSAYTDFLHFVACGKPCIRTCVQDNKNLTAIANWCNSHNFAFQTDEDGYICVAHDTKMAKAVLKIDRSVIPHTFELGQMLGYPACCFTSVHEIEEENIDSFADEIFCWEFNGIFKLINPSDYLNGQALICHLPCSPTCVPSLQLAKKALGFIKIHYFQISLLKNWSKWL
jgi:hypothetical protein